MDDFHETFPTPRDGVKEIEAERQYQIDCGFDRNHDRGHRWADLAVAAATLACDGTDAYVEDPDERNAEGGWMHELMVKNREDRIHQLAIAGAFIAAEIDRLKGLE